MKQTSIFTVFIAFFVIFFLCLSCRQGYSQSIVIEKGKSFEPKTFYLPYAFHYDSFGTSLGFVAGINGKPQKQMSLLATVIAGSNDALALYAIARDVQMPFAERIFVDADLALSRFGDINSYANGNPAFSHEQAGSNDSSARNYIDGRGSDNLARVKFRYLLPMGNAKNEIINTLVLEKGILSEGKVGGDSWNPLESGKTYLEAKPFWRTQTVHSEYRLSERVTDGVEFSFFRENTDFPKNPSRGSTLRARYTQDWGWFASSNPYNVVDIEWSKYFSFGGSNKFRQRVLAFDFWTANVLSWDDYNTRNNSQKVYHRPPPYAGAMLGGLWRMRAYPTSRFNDQAAIYYAMEYRMIPEWNPFAKMEWVQKHIEIAWWQWVPFVEAGRVAPNWNVDTLHSKMQWDVGFGIRAMAKGMTVRIDTAVSPEGWGINMMIGHPFQF